MAHNIMLHFEMLREKQLRQRAWNMNLCLATFVSLEHQSRATEQESTPEDAEIDHCTYSSISGVLQQNTYDDGAGTGVKASKRNARSSQQRESSPGPEVAENYEKLKRAQHSSTVEGNDQSTTFRRAADLLGDALDLRHGGGVVFFDTFTAITGDSKSPVTKRMTTLKLGCCGSIFPTHAK